MTNPMISRLLCPCALALILAGCGSEQTPTDRAIEETEEAAAAIGDLVDSQRKKLAEKLRGQLDAMEERIGSLELEESKREAAAKLRENRKDLEEKLAELANSAEDAWEELGEELGEAAEALERELDKLTRE